MVVPLTPKIPMIEPAAQPDGPAAELIVMVNHGTFWDKRSLEGFSVLVDGTVRGWIPEMGSYITLRVVPGEHRLTVSHPWKHFGILFGIPWPESGEVRTEIPVTCLPLSQCAVTVAPVVDPHRGLVLVPDTVSADEIAARIRGLKSVDQKE